MIVRDRVYFRLVKIYHSARQTTFVNRKDMNIQTISSMPK